jgi:hypothetical protein
MPFCRDFTGATGLEPATSGVTGRSWRFRAERGLAGIPAVSGSFRPCGCGDSRVLAGASGSLLRDERGMRRCLHCERGENLRGCLRRLRCAPSSRTFARSLADSVVSLIFRRLQGSSRRRSDCRLLAGAVVVAGRAGVVGIGPLPRARRWLRKGQSHCTSPGSIQTRLLRSEPTRPLSTSKLPTASSRFRWPRLKVGVPIFATNEPM